MGAYEEASNKLAKLGNPKGTCRKCLKLPGGSEKGLIKKLLA